MRTRRVVVLATVLLTMVTTGCAELDDERTDRLFQQDGDDQVPEANEAERSPETSGAPPIDEQGNATIHFVDVGQGDGIVVHLPDHTVVYDTGRWYGDSQRAVRDHLQDEDADPDTLVISHPDADHAGGCQTVLEAFTIEAIYHPGVGKDTRTWRDCEQAMQAEGAPIYTDADLAIGQTLDWSDHALVQLLHVDADARDANAGSIALEITYGDTDVVLAGDLTCEAEEAILDRGIVGTLDVFQVAHHGSSTSTCDPWLQETQPEAGVISVGDNDYGHPHQEVLDRLAHQEVDVYRTDHHGTVEITTDGSSWELRTEVGDEPDEQDPTQTDDNDTTAPTDRGPVAIGHVRYDAEGNDNENLNDEWVEIVHEGNQTVDIGGWSLADEADHTYTFPANTTLDPDGNLTVHTGSGEDTAEHRYWGRNQAVWNNAGDTVDLRDGSGELVDRKGY